MAVTESSGNGYALYNGVKLQNIDSVWTDKTSFSCATLVSMQDGIHLVLSNNVIQYGTSSKQFVYNGPSSLYHFVDGSFSLYSSTSNAGTFSLSGVNSLLWSNVDISTGSGVLVISASSPIPLDGMTVIEWDGDTSGLTTAGTDAMTIALLSEKIPDITKPAAEVIVTTEGGTMHAYTESATYDETYGRYFWNATLWHGYYPKATDVATTPGIYVTKTLIANTTSYSLFAFYEGEATEETTFDLKSWLIGYALGLSGKPLPIKVPVAYLYNGVRLPKLPDVEGYPYKYVYYHTYRCNCYEAIYSNKPFTAEVDFGGYGNCIQAQYLINTDLAVKSYDLIDGVWVWMSSSGELVYKGDISFHWANYDIFFTDSTDIYLAASDPVPVYE